jgi:hypothetical protein
MIMMKRSEDMQNIQDLIDYLSTDLETYELVVMPSQHTRGLWVAMIRECGPDGMVRIDSDTDQMVMQVCDSIPLALAALEFQCGGVFARIEQYDWEREQEDLEILY